MKHSLQVSLLISFFALLPTQLRSQVPENFAVAISAEIQTSPPSITLHWVADPLASGYKVFRRTFAGSDDFAVLGSGTAADTSYVDKDVQVGTRYEYEVFKNWTANKVNYEGWGYIAAAIKAPLIDRMGKLILVVDDSIADSLATELARYEQDLIGDGWSVVRHNVPRNGSDTAICNMLLNDWTNDADTIRTVFLFGHVPVPYSGLINPDGHPNHLGAWPADVYYGCMNANMQGYWSDDLIDNDTSASYAANFNVPGDGKFDQDEAPLPLDMEVGRVDLSHMPTFPMTEIDLLKQYMDKDHAFRIGKLTAPARGLISDNFGAFTGNGNAESFASTAWRAFPAMFGIQNTVAGNWFGTLDTAAYLWAYGCGGGDPTDAGGIGSTSDFATKPCKAIFTCLFGSWFGDWNFPNDFMRAPLCTPYSLTCEWAGRPLWELHPMAIGETIGFCAKLTQDSAALYVPLQVGTLLYDYATDYNYPQSFVCADLMGDPTLKLTYVLPAAATACQVVNKNRVLVSWGASPDSGIEGYNVYRSVKSTGPFIHIGAELPKTSLAFTDSLPFNDSDFYMVRAVKLLATASGSYYGASQGTVVSATGIVGGLGVETWPAVAASSIRVYPISGGLSIDITNGADANVELGVYDITGREIASLKSGFLQSGNSHYNWNLRSSTGGLAPSGVYFVRMTGGQQPLIAKYALVR